MNRGPWVGESFCTRKNKNHPHAGCGPTGKSIFALQKVFLLARRKFADIASKRFRFRPTLERDRITMQTNPETVELLGDWHPLVQQLGSTDGLIALSTA